MLKRYRTSSYSVNIEEKEFLSETEKFLCYEVKSWQGNTEKRRDAKHSEYCQYHQSYEAALDFLIEREKQSLEILKRKTNACNSQLGELLSKKRKLQNKVKDEG